MEFFRAYKHITLLLAFLMFFTSTGLSLDMHYCQGQLKSISFIGKAKSCHEKESHCKKHKASCQSLNQNTKESSDNSCCNNKTVTVQLDVEYIDAQAPTIDLNSFQFLVAYTNVFVVKNNIYSTSTIPFQNYKPPLLTRDIPVLIQSFLI